MARGPKRRGGGALPATRLTRSLDTRQIVIDLDTPLPITSPEAAPVETFLDDELRTAGVYEDVRRTSGARRKN
jgi:hypothetical protein